MSERQLKAAELRGAKKLIILLIKLELQWI